MRIDIVSLFPDMFRGPFNDSIIRRAQDNGILNIHILNPRDFSFDKHKHVDDSPFGRGSGMVLKPEPMFRAIRFLSETTACERRRVLLMSPDGEVFSQGKAKELSAYDQLIFLCGHYEGFDARITELADEILSVGDYVLTGGELPALVLTDSVCRMIPGVLSDQICFEEESHYSGLLEYPQYTKPAEWRGMEVPEVLLSGHHANIEKWRREQSLLETARKRPDLFKLAELSEKEKEFVQRNGIVQEEKSL